MNKRRKKKKYPFNVLFCTRNASLTLRRIWRKVSAWNSLINEKINNKTTVEPKPINKSSSKKLADNKYTIMMWININTKYNISRDIKY